MLKEADVDALEHLSAHLLDRFVAAVVDADMQSDGVSVMVHLPSKFIDQNSCREEVIKHVPVPDDRD